MRHPFRSSCWSKQKLTNELKFLLGLKNIKIIHWPFLRCSTRLCIRRNCPLLNQLPNCWQLLGTSQNSRPKRISLPRCEVYFLIKRTKLSFNQFWEIKNPLLKFNLRFNHLENSSFAKIYKEKTCKITLLNITNY